MLRSALCVAMLAVWLVALQCKADGDEPADRSLPVDPVSSVPLRSDVSASGAEGSTEDHDDVVNEDNDEDVATDNLSASSRSSASIVPAKPAGQEAELSSPAAPEAKVSDAEVPVVKVPDANPPVNGGGPLAPNGHAEPTGGTASTEGRDTCGPSDKKDHTSPAPSAAAAAAASSTNNAGTIVRRDSSALSSSVPGSPTVDKDNSALSPPTVIFPGVSTGAASSSASTSVSGISKPKEELEQAKENQEKNSKPQKPINGGESRATSSLPHSGQQKPEENISTSGRSNDKAPDGITKSKELQSKNNQKNNGKPVTDVLERPKMSTDTNTVNTVPKTKVVTDTQKAQLVVTTDTESKINLTTTTTTNMVDNVDSTKVVNKPSTAPTIPLNKLSKAAQQLQSLDNKDSSSSSSLLLAFATFFTIAATALAPAY